MFVSVDKTLYELVGSLCKELFRISTNSSHLPRQESLFNGHKHNRWDRTDYIEHVENLQIYVKDVKASLTVFKQVLTYLPFTDRALERYFYLKMLKNVVDCILSYRHFIYSTFCGVRTGDGMQNTRV
jgi:hypothetical protein